MRIKILPTCLRGNYRDNLGELSNTSYGGFEADRFNITFTFDYKKQFQSIANGNSDSIICHYIWSPNTFTVYHFNLVNHETF